METPTRPPQEQSPGGGGHPVAPSSVSRLWRPAAQRNLRNQWSKMASLRSKWVSASSAGKSNAVSLVNAFLSQNFLQVAIVTQMVDASRTMRCYLKGTTNSSLIKFDSSSDDSSDAGDGVESQFLYSCQSPATSN